MLQDSILTTFAAKYSINGLHLLNIYLIENIYIYIYIYIYVYIYIKSEDQDDFV